jgi:8-oxo-dGTP pyrophosphatase MutT (NUDIX family)
VSLDARTVARLIRSFEPADDQARESARRTLALLETHPAPFSRSSYEPGHVTSSAIVLSPDGMRVALVYHQRAGGWVQPGGHVEPEDQSITATAAREVAEETGLSVEPAGAVLLRVDVHQIPAAGPEPQHLHHDLTFGMTAFRDRPDRPGESRWVWCDVAEVAQYQVDHSLAASVQRARERMAGRR